MAERVLCTIVEQARQFVALDAAGGRSDRELLDQWLRRRDEAAFTTLVQRHAAMVLGVCRRVLKHGQDAEDATQATFLVFPRTAASIRKPTIDFLGRCRPRRCGDVRGITAPATPGLSIPHRIQAGVRFRPRSMKR